MRELEAGVERLSGMKAARDAQWRQNHDLVGKVKQAREERDMWKKRANAKRVEYLNELGAENERMWETLRRLQRELCMTHRKGVTFHRSKGCELILRDRHPELFDDDDELWVSP